MRDHQEAQTDRTKRCRRRWLFALVLASSPCVAEEPQNSGIGVLPPLPLNSNTAAPAVRTNPFCAPEAEPPESPVLLTTGASQNSRSVHLSPIGAAIGLNPIGTEQRNTNAAQRGPIMTIEPAHQSTVQINPLLQSIHRENHDLVDTNLAPAHPVSHSTTDDRSEKATPIRSEAEPPILLVTPAPKRLLVVEPQKAAVPVTVPPSLAKPLNATALPDSAEQGPPDTDTTGKPKTDISGQAAGKKTTRVSQPKTTSARNAKSTGAEKVQPKTVPNAKPRQKPNSEKRKAGASIASMLTQKTQNPAAASKKENPAPIFFSLSDTTEVAPSEKSVPQRQTIILPSLTDPTGEPGKAAVPLSVTVKEDGSIVTAERRQTEKTASKQSPIPQPILAGQSRLGAEARLPAPKTLPSATAAPKRVPTASETAQRKAPSGNSILSKSATTPEPESHKKLSVATVKQFKPRTGSPAVKAITPAKPFSLFGEKAKPMVDAMVPEQAPSIIAQAPKATKPAPKATKPAPEIAKPTTVTESDNGKLTLPTPINIASDVASPSVPDSTERSVIKVQVPSPKATAKTNPHAELTKENSKPELVNPFNRQKSNRPSAAKEPGLPMTAEETKAVRVEKFTITKERPKTKLDLDSVLDSNKTAKETPVASGVVDPIALDEAVEQTQRETEAFKAKPIAETAKAQPSAGPLNAIPETGLTEPAKSVADKPTSVASTARDAGDEASGATILRKRYRPPVAVQAIPGTVTRQKTVASKEPAKVQAVPEMILGDRKAQPPTVNLQQAMRLDTASELKDRGLVLGPDVRLTPLHMNQAQVRSLTLGGAVRGVRVGDKGVCQAFASGPNQLKLIGTGIGTTRLVVWAQKDGDDSEVLMRAFEIHVDEVVPNEGNSIESTTLLLNQSIQKVFPQSRAKVQLVKGELWVTGSCESQDSAEKIIRMVRKSCLIPVRDQLTIK